MEAVEGLQKLTKEMQQAAVVLKERMQPPLNPERKPPFSHRMCLQTMTAQANLAFHCHERVIQTCMNSPSEGPVRGGHQAPVSNSESDILKRIKAKRGWFGTLCEFCVRLGLSGFLESWR